MENLDFNTYETSGLDSIDDGLNDDIFQAPEDPITIESNHVQQDDYSPASDAYSQISKEALSSYLKTNGIKDINSIRFEDENGVEYTKRFDELSDEEKINILRGDLEDYDLSDDEIYLLNKMRANNLDSAGLEKYIADYYMKQYYPQMDQEPEYNYKIDDITDDELFMGDLKSRFPNASDDELIKMFEMHKQDESLYSKTVNDLRDFYRGKEDELIKEQEEEIERTRQQQEYAYVNSVDNALQNFNNIGELELDPQDKQQIFKVLTEYDNTGNRYINTLLQDPNNLVKATWFLLHGENSIYGLSDYYKKEITNSRNNSRNSNTYTSVTVPKTVKNDQKGYSLSDLDF